MRRKRNDEQVTASEAADKISSHRLRTGLLRSDKPNNRQHGLDTKRMKSVGASVLGLTLLITTRNRAKMNSAYQPAEREKRQRFTRPPESRPAERLDRTAAITSTRDALSAERLTYSRLTANQDD
jgi:hypothetical protein